jgi:hypothetical protein
MEAEGKRNDLQFLLEALKSCQVSSDLLFFFARSIDFNISFNTVIPKFIYSLQ